MYGKTYMGVVRTTYLINPDGNVAEAWTKVKARGHAEIVLKRLKEIKG
jgi:peroxiredoxin Q/BCP